MNLDGYALPIKKLKGTEPVESLDLSGKKLGVASTIVIASLISVNSGSLTSLDLSDTQLCGVTSWGSGTYTTEGITAIADALRVNGSLTSLDVRSNYIAGIMALHSFQPQSSATSRSRFSTRSRSRRCAPTRSRSWT